jgi:quercetin dioxygenase-like cupin family protein
MLRTSVILAAALMLSGGVALAQSPQTAPPNPPLTPSPVKRNIISKAELPNSNYEVTTAVVEMAPGFKAPRHIHPGTVTAYVIDGACWFAPDGQPEKTYSAGEAFVLPDHAIHAEGAATADKPCKMYAVYVLEKGQPLVIPVK